jgi:hypothetical protein
MYISMSYKAGLIFRISGSHSGGYEEVHPFLGRIKLPLYLTN